MASLTNWLFQEMKPSSPVSSPKPTPFTAEQIHDDFDSASEKLLKEVEIALQKADETSKGLRMAKLGFTSTQQAKDAQKEYNNKQLYEYWTTKIRHYQTFYPNNKFITGNDAAAICKKYGLLLGDAAKYIGDIPGKNLQEIEDFILLEQDMTKHECGYVWFSDPRNYRSFQEKPEKFDFYGYVEIDYAGLGTRWTRRSVPEGTPYVYTKPDFKICAPITDFDTAGMRVDGHRLVHDIKDPIVLQPVDGGYLIVSKWGLEAGDPIAVNPKEN